jgi:hypothetical protein
VEIIYSREETIAYKGAMEEILHARFLSYTAPIVSHARQAQDW